MEFDLSVRFLFSSLMPDIQFLLGVNQFGGFVVPSLVRIGPDTDIPEDVFRREQQGSMLRGSPPCEGITLAMNPQPASDAILCVSCCINPSRSEGQAINTLFVDANLTIRRKGDIEILEATHGV